MTEGERTFHDKNKVKEFLITKPILHKTVEAIIQTKEKDKHTQETIDENK